MTTTTDMPPITDISVFAFIQRIEAALQSGTPSSFIRFNDGEARLVGNISFFPPSMITQSITKYFGDNSLTNDQLTDLSNRVLDAVSKADVVGLPPADWPWDFACARDIVARADIKKPIISTHVDFHQRLFESDFFRNFFKQTRPISLVTCRDVLSYLNNVYGATIQDVYLVPEQADGSYSGLISRHFPDHCDWLCRVLEKSAADTVFLVGAGICGKLYCEAIRRGGGIAIDIGSIFDLWAGRFSRPYMDTYGVRDYYLGRLSRLDLDVPAIQACAEIFTLEGNLDVAIRTLEYGELKYPYVAELFVHKIKLLYRAGKADVATPLARDRISEMSAPLLLLVGRMLKRNDLKEDSNLFFLAAFKKHPLFAPVVTELCDILLSKPAFTENVQRQILEAADYLKKGNFHQLLFQLARVYGARGQFELAISYCKAAIDLFSLDNNYFLHQVAWLEAIGRKKDAEIYQAAMHRFVQVP